MRAAGLERADGTIVCARCVLAETAWTRMRGLLRVLCVVSELRVWRAAGRRGARTVPELPAGAAARVGLREGDELLLRT